MVSSSIEPDAEDWALVPRPLPPPPGSPAPLGGMLMSQRATSSALTEAPNAGGLPGAGCKLAQAASAAAKTAMTRARSDVDIFHVPVRAHRPADDGIVVITHVRRELREPDFARRLHAPFLVGSAALQHRRSASPFPGKTKTHQALRPLLADEPRLRPARAAVGGDFDPADAACAAPGDPRDLVEARARQHHGRRRLGDHRLHAHLEGELQRA